jgi:hypothetical protein
VAGYFDDLVRIKAQPANPQEVERRLEAVGQGAFGFGDEIGATLQGILGKAHGQDFGDTYNQALAENRDLLHREYQAEPGRAAALSTLSSIPFTLAAGNLGATRQAAGDIGLAARMGGTPLKAGLTQAAIAGAPVGAAFGAGTSEARQLPELARDTLAGGAVGALTSMGTRAAANAASNIPALQRLAANLAKNRLFGKIQEVSKANGWDGPVLEEEYVGPPERAWSGYRPPTEASQAVTNPGGRPRR